MYKKGSEMKQWRIYIWLAIALAGWAIAWLAWHAII
jgi:hypothetical protein